jgi:hypothetical protein
MSEIIGVMGESGTGKSTALRNLDPASTLIIDADQKGLSWRGWKSQYNAAAHNYLRTSNPHEIKQILNQVNLIPHIKVVVIDTMNAIMVDDELARMQQKGYDKWIDLAQDTYQIVQLCNALRDDLFVILCFHTEIIDLDDGKGLSRIRTAGRKLQKIGLETKLPILLRTRVECSATEGNKYYFETQALNSTAKSPMDMFNSFLIPNDLKLVIDAVRNYDTIPSSVQA